MLHRRTVLVMILSAALLTVGAGTDKLDAPPPPGPKERCAVCGMYVAKYPAWVATIVRTDSSHLFFDGPKDMFKYLLDPKKYRHDPADIAAIWVTDYYTTRPIAAREARFVVGSDVMGPMGAELVPVSTPEAAAAFAADHGATATLSFDEVGPEDIPR